MNISGENSGQQNRPGQNNMNNMSGMGQNTGNMNRPVRPGQSQGGQGPVRPGNGPVRPGNGPVRPGQGQGGQGPVRPGSGPVRPNPNSNMGQQNLNNGINLNKQSEATGQSGTNSAGGVGSVNINKTPVNANQNMNNMNMGEMNQNTVNMGQNMNDMNQQMNNMNQQLIQPQKRSNVGLVGLILSIVGLVCCGQILQIPALICSIIGIKKDKSDKRALVGIIISAVGILLWTLLMINGVATIRSSINNKMPGGDLDLGDIYSDENAYTDDRYADTEDVYDDDSLGVVPSTEDSDYDYEDSDESHSSIYDDWDEEDDNSDNDEVKNYNSNVDPTNIMVTGANLVFGKDTAEDVFKKTGLQFNDEDLKSVIEPDVIGYVPAYIQDNAKNVAYFYFCNTTDKARPLRECTLHKIDFVAAEYQNGNSLDQWLDGILDGGIDTRATLEKVEDILGEPDNSYNDDDTGVQIVEYYNQFDQDYKLSFGYYNGKMYEMEVGKY